MKTEKIYYRRAEIAEIFGVDPSTIVRWVKDGHIKEYRIFEASRVPLYMLEDIKKTLNNYKQGGGTKQ